MGVLMVSLISVSFATFLSWDLFEILPDKGIMSNNNEWEERIQNGSMSMSWDEYEGCYGEYCWFSKDEFFLKVEQKFVADLLSGRHTKDYTDKNKCDKYNISSIAYGFSAVEHWNWDSNLVHRTNNIASLKESGKGYQYVRKREYGKFKGYLKYPNKFEALLDFMYLYKYAYGCSVGKKSVWIYKMWKNLDISDPNFKRYYKNVLQYIEFFQNKNFTK